MPKKCIFCKTKLPVDEKKKEDPGDDNKKKYICGHCYDDRKDEFGFYE